MKPIGNSSKFNARIILATTVLLAILTQASNGYAQDDRHKEARCGAYFTLASCDREECGERNRDKYEGDQVRLAIGDHRCNDKLRRALKRPNRKFDCGFNTCNVDFFDKKVMQAEKAYRFCRVENEVEELGDAHLQECMDACGRKLIDLFTLAAANYCENVELPWSCDVWDDE